MGTSTRRRFGLGRGGIIHSRRLERSNVHFAWEQISRMTRVSIDYAGAFASEPDPHSGLGSFRPMSSTSLSNQR